MSKKGLISNIRNRMRANQQGTNIHTEAALKLAIAEQEIETASKNREASEKQMVRDASSDAKQKNIQTALNVGTGILKSAAAGDKGLFAKKKGSAELVDATGDGGGGGKGLFGRKDSGGVNSKKLERQANRQAKRQANFGDESGKPKVKGGLLAPLFTGGRVSTKGDWTDKGYESLSTGQQQKYVQSNQLAVDKVGGWGSTEAAEPKKPKSKNPLYTLKKSKKSADAPATLTSQDDNYVPVDVPAPPIAGDPRYQGKKSTGQTKTASTPDAYGGVFRTDVGESTEAYAKIYRMNPSDRADAISKLTPKQRARYSALVSAYEKRKGSS